MLPRSRLPWTVSDTSPVADAAIRLYTWHHRRCFPLLELSPPAIDAPGGSANGTPSIAMYDPKSASWKTCRLPDDEPQFRILVEELTRAPRMDSGRAPAAEGSGSTGPAADEEGSAATAAAARSPAGRAIPAQSR